MSKYKDLKKKVNFLDAKLSNHIWEEYCNSSPTDELEALYDKIQFLESVLIESGILETDWKPSAPKGSVIQGTGYESYTKINKVF